MLRAWWRWTWPRLEPWLNNLIWLDPTLAAACWTAGVGAVSAEDDEKADTATSAFPGELRLA